MMKKIKLIVAAIVVIASASGLFSFIPVWPALIIVGVGLAVFVLIPN
jgi:hypothetical protein